MRATAFVTLGAVTLIVAACISYQAATPAPTPPPTAAPTVPPTAPPTTPPTEPPTAPPTTPPTAPPTEGPPTPTPDPNATPRPTAVDIAPYLTSQVTVVNLADEPLSLTVALLDPESTDEYVIGTFEVQPEQVTTQSVIPAHFRLDFTYGGGATANAGTCSINIADGEQLQFAVITSGIVMTSNGTEPDDPAEMIVATATRCQENPAP